MAALPREYHDYVFMWIGRNISFLDGASGPSLVPVSSVQVSTGFMLPPNAIVVQIFVAVTTAFNAATTNTFDVGSASAPTALLSGSNINAVAAGAASPATLGGLLSSTSPVELFTRYNFTGANPTAGAGRVMIKYVVDPDRRK